MLTKQENDFFFYFDHVGLNLKLFSGIYLKSIKKEVYPFYKNVFFRSWEKILFSNRKIVFWPKSFLWEATVRLLAQWE